MITARVGKAIVSSMSLTCLIRFELTGFYKSVNILITQYIFRSIIENMATMHEILSE